MNRRVLQARTDALVAEYIYSINISKINALGTTINVLTILVPIIVTSILLLTKGTKYEEVSAVISILLSAILLALVVLTLILKTEDKKINYYIGRRSNIYIANESLKHLDKNDSELEWFYTYLVEMDSKDSENIGKSSDKLKQEALREALKKQIPGDNTVVCSICFASPFNFKPGTCQVCGNTPKENP